MTLLGIALFAFAGNVVVASAFTLMGRQGAKERQFLVNAALSNNSYEFAVRQAASGEVPERQETDPPEYIFPEGL